MLLRSQVANPVFEKLPETRVRGSVGGETARRGLTEMCFPRRRRVCHRFWMMGRNMQTSAELRREPPAPRPALPTGTRPDWTMGETGFFCESPLPVSALLAEASRGGPPGGWCAARCPVYAWLAGWPAGGPSASMCRYSGCRTAHDDWKGRLRGSSAGDEPATPNGKRFAIELLTRRAANETGLRQGAVSRLAPGACPAAAGQIGVLVVVVGVVGVVVGWDGPWLNEEEEEEARCGRTAVCKPPRVPWQVECCRLQVGCGL